MNSQKSLFSLPENIHYLNCGYMSPLLKSVEEAGIKGMLRKRNPSSIFADDFFDDAVILRQVFGQLVNCGADQVAIIPSTSYGFQNALNNIPGDKGSFVITVTDEFPSDYYTLRRWCDIHHKELKIINDGGHTDQRGRNWNENILNSITQGTAIVNLSSIHWMDGTLFDLKAIGKRCKEVDAVFIVDGTQSVGALPMDVKDYQIDVLVCAAYKWLLGPYSMGAAYYSEQFNNGVPIEESWLNRTNAREFARISNYTSEYTPGAGRYNVGEYSNFILTPMFIRSLDQILSWNVKSIQDYCGKLIDPLLAYLEKKGIATEEDRYRANHLFGFRLPANIDSRELLTELQKRKVFVSLRGNSIRVSPHLYNDKKDIEALIDSLDKMI